MKFFALICSAKFWLTLMISLTMSVGTLAADIHPADADEIECENGEVSIQLIEIDVSGDTNKDSGDRPPHHHHAHNCGTCHIHVVGPKLTQLSIALNVSRNFRLRGDQDAPRAGPLGLYRPPRS